MKSLAVGLLIGFLSVASGSLNPTSGVPAAPGFHLGVRPATSVGGHYRVESENADGSRSGHYGYQTEGQNVQVTYSTAAQNQPSASNNDATLTMTTVSAADTKTDENGTTQIDDTGLTTPSQQPQTPDAVNPDNVIPLAFVPFNSYQQPNQFFQTRPLTNVNPHNQYFAYSHTPQFVPQSGHYAPYYLSGQHRFYNLQPFVQTAYGASSSGQSSTAGVSQFPPNHSAAPHGYSGTAGAAGVLQARPYPQPAGQISPSGRPSTAQVYSFSGPSSLSASGVSHIQPSSPSDAVNRYYQSFPFAYSAPQYNSHRFGFAQRHGYPSFQQTVY